MAVGSEHPFVFHLVQATLWEEAVRRGAIYYPPTYDVDGFTHGTSNPEKLLNVANHFYQDVPGDWFCLKMTVESLLGSGVATVYEGTAAVGDIAPDFDGAEGELFPHLMGGIAPAAVIEVLPVTRDDAGTFLTVESVS